MYTRRKGGGVCLRTERGGKDVGISKRRGATCTSPLANARGVLEVSATCDGDGIAEVDGSLVFPEVLRPAKASVPGSLSPMSAKYFRVQRWARMQRRRKNSP